ncbi:MAG: hypothetical protein HIU85_05020 [Proteobacteria bacterium]|nr:hypothetical protein [Pseudomonadota bacterium]
MRLEWSTLTLQLVNFAILVWLLQRFLYRPVLRTIDARRAALLGQQAQAASEAEAAKRQLADLEAQRAGLAGERAAALARTEEEGRALLAARQAQAQREAQGLLEEGRRTLARERELAQEELRSAALDLAADIASRVLAQIPEPLRVQAWLERIEGHLTALPREELRELSDQLSGGGTLRVVTAAPLAAGAQEQWRARLRAAAAPEASVAFDTEPGLIAGAELRFPHARLGFSVQGAIAALQQEVRSHGPDR